MSNYKLYMDPKICKALTLARKQAKKREERRKAQLWRERRVLNYKEQQYAQS